jgi:nitrate/nitrite transport system ATP-binding protein
MTSVVALAPGVGNERGQVLLCLDAVSKAFTTKKTRQPAIDGISLVVHDGEFVALIGPSGCGKTTIINLLAGLLRPDAGTIQLGGSAITGPGADRGVVFQHHVLLPWMTAYENVRFALDCTMPRVPAAERDRLARHYLAVVELAGAGDKKPGQLSGGMQQRVGLARAFAIQPKVLLLDEPFGSLDAVTRVVLQEQLLRIWEAERRTVVMVTHDVDEALLLADRVVVLSHGPGAVVRREVSVPFPHPRDRARVVRESAYHGLRGELLSLLTRELAS